jgi:hypothetical protein
MLALEVEPEDTSCKSSWEDSDLIVKFAIVLQSVLLSSHYLFYRQSAIRDGVK